MEKSRLFVVRFYCISNSKKKERQKEKKGKRQNRYIVGYFWKILTLTVVALMIFTNNLGCLILNQLPLVSFLSKPVFQFSDLTLKDKYMKRHLKSLWMIIITNSRRNTEAAHLNWLW